MCFSANASFSAAAVLFVAGAVTVRRAEHRAELPFALIPILFAVQQLIEGVIWLTLPVGPAPLTNVLTHSYSFFSHVFWPVYVPLAVLFLEPVRRRRRALFGIALTGGALGLYLLYVLVRLPVVAEVRDGHIAYLSPHFYALEVMALYVLSTCVSLMVSSHSAVRLFGAAAFLSFMAASYFYTIWLISVWCFFAALLSGIVLLHFRGHSGRLPNGVVESP